ncbi:MAG TPA: MBL fold metallo-hydrolase [bacterium]|jgi:metallo-beta-lactamase family protein|nr:MBL fold metallo-hydrolase [bacterium]HOG38369.1 MBL fold metallo-hydrolase [bacterium]HQI03612.1 MBL fold metallo-hydrolase [bacterium]
MKISFHGACKEVTGSCILVESDNFKFLVDCGSFQGQEFSSDRNAQDFIFDPKLIDFVLLTHSHLDHCGRLPKLFQEGFRGMIYCTRPTKDLVYLILMDALKIMKDKESINKKLQYTLKDVEGVMNLIKCLDYNDDFDVNKFVRIRLKDAGHILGSAFFEVYIKENNKEKKIVFSGDLGNPPTPIIRDTEFSDGADIVVVESTYGGLLHEDKEIGKSAIKNVILETIKNKSVLIVPVFAVERSQEVLYELNNLVENNLIPEVPMFFDSPMGINAIDIYRKYLDFYDEDTKKLIDSGDDIFIFPKMKYTLTPFESKKINNTQAPKIILAGSGMCNGGRVLHHLKFNLSNPKTNVMLLSFQAKDTLGRKLMEGEKNVLINEVDVEVRAKISVFGCFSSHADEKKLENWLSSFTKIKPKTIFINHGEEDRSIALQNNLKKTTKAKILIPEFGVKYNI